MQVFHFADLVLKERILEAMDQGVTRYPVHRTVRFAARGQAEQLFDLVAVDAGFRAWRTETTAVVLEDGDALVIGNISSNARYSSCTFEVWAGSPAGAESVRERILARFGDRRITEPTFSVDWYFQTARGGLEFATIEEIADDVLLDEAYPSLPNGVAAFVKQYLDSPEAVLVLQGPPGTGKTRLVRAVLGELARRDDDAAALYTGDSKTLENDEVFVRFITGTEKVFIVEDADHMLKPRSKGNEHLHRFLTVADGVVRSQGRKIVFSTNLPNVGDLDDALIRPGRCFARLHLRELTLDEAGKLLRRLVSAERAAAGVETLASRGRRSHSVADVYQLARS